MTADLIQNLGLWFLLLVMSSLLFAALFPGFSRLVVNAEVSARTWLWLCYGSMPWLVSTIAVAVTLSPDAAGYIVPAHCHGEHCAPHQPMMGEQPERVVLLSSLAVATLACLALGLFMAQRARHQKLKLLLSLSRADADASYRTVTSNSPLALCAGLLRQQVLLSSAAVTALSAGELRAVVAHEYAHMRRFDNLRKFWLLCASRLWPERQRLALLQVMAADTETACDVQASRHIGGTGDIASALYRLAQNGPKDADAEVHSRIQRLSYAFEADKSAAASGSVPGLLVVVFAATVGLACSVPVHIVMESLGS